MLELEVETGGDVPATVRVDVKGRVTHVDPDDESEEVYETWSHFCEAVGIEDSEAAFEGIEGQIEPDVFERVKMMDLDSADDVLAECAREMAEPEETAPVKAAPKVKTAPKVTTAPKVKTAPKVSPMAAKKSKAKAPKR